MLGSNQAGPHNHAGLRRAADPHQHGQRRSPAPAQLAPPAVRLFRQQVALTPQRPLFRLIAMEVHFPTDKETRLRQLATRTGKKAEQVVEEAVDRMLEYDAQFVEAVEEGRAAARRGDLLEHDEVVERIEQMFRP